jgi:hypothetical protein
MQTRPAEKTLPDDISSLTPYKNNALEARQSLFWPISIRNERGKSPIPAFDLLPPAYRLSGIWGNYSDKDDI